jgi:hypothetical protein
MCTTLYKNNLCDQPIPAMVEACARWEACTNRDPSIVGRAKVGAEMIAEVLNGFIEPISWKAWVGLFFLFSASFKNNNAPSRLLLRDFENSHPLFFFFFYQAFTLSSLAFLTLFINALLSLYRSRHRHDGNNVNTSGLGAGHHHHQLPHPDAYSGGGGYPSPDVRDGGMPWAPSSSFPLPRWRGYRDEGDGDHKIRYRTKASLESSIGQNGKAG